MRRIRRSIRRLARRVGWPFAAAAVLVVVGSGVHAALDWHHHGVAGAGFFHLHVHFGEHRHPAFVRLARSHGAADEAADGGHHGHHHEGAAGRRHGPAVDHHHPDHATPDPDPPAGPGSDPPGHRRHAGVLTVALAVAPAPTTASVVGPALEPGARTPVAARRLADRPSERRQSSPRAPPA